MPTIKNISGPYRFFFYSFDCNEPKHVHVQRERLTCKFWIDPIMLAKNNGFSPKELNQLLKKVRSNIVKITEGWDEHCG